MIIHLGGISCSLPQGPTQESTERAAPTLLFGLAPDGVWLQPTSHLVAGKLLPYLFTFTQKLGGLFLWHFP